MPTVPNACEPIKPKTKTHTVLDDKMTRVLDLEAQKKRSNIQTYFWGIVGSAEHINLPKLEDAIRKEFHTSDGRVIDAQIRLMQSEGRIRVQEAAKVWIRQPPL